MAADTSWSQAAREVVQATIDLVRAEVAALTADLSEQGRLAGRVGLLLLFVGVFAFWGLGAAFAGAILALTMWVQPWLAALLVALALFLVTAVLGWMARRRIQELRTPANVTIERIGDTAAWWEREFGQPRGPEASRLEPGGLGREVDGDASEASDSDERDARGDDPLREDQT